MKESLSARDAIEYMLRGGTLIDEVGEPVHYDAGKGCFCRINDWGQYVIFFSGLKEREEEKTPVLMTSLECRIWSNSLEAHNWMVRLKDKNSEEAWHSPSFFDYVNPDKLERVRILSDRTGIDEETITGFYRKV